MSRLTALEAVVNTEGTLVLLVAPASTWPVPSFFVYPESFTGQGH